MGRRFSAGMEFCQFPSRFSRSDGRGRPSHIVARASPPAVPALKLKRRPIIKPSLRDGTFSVPKRAKQKPRGSGADSAALLPRGTFKQSVSMVPL